jgi:hypothetical protein
VKVGEMRQGLRLHVVRLQASCEVPPTGVQHVDHEYSSVCVELACVRDGCAFRDVHRPDTKRRSHTKVRGLCVPSKPSPRI